MGQVRGEIETSRTKIKAIEARLGELEVAVAACENDIDELRAQVQQRGLVKETPLRSKARLAAKLALAGAAIAAGALGLLFIAGLLVRRRWLASASARRERTLQAEGSTPVSRVGGAVRSVGYWFLAAFAAIASWLANLANPSREN